MKIRFTSDAARQECMRNPGCASLASRASQVSVRKKRRFQVRSIPPGDAVALMAGILGAAAVARWLETKRGKSCGCDIRRRRMNQLGWIGCAKAAARLITNYKPAGWA